MTLRSCLCRNSRRPKSTAAKPSAAVVAAARTAKVLIAEVNEQMPRTHGNTLVPLSALTAYVYTNHTLPSHPPSGGVGGGGDRRSHITRLVPDGVTLPLGIGVIPDAVLSRVFDKHDLSVHTEMFSDRPIDLVDAGVITKRCNEVYPARVTTSFAIGSQRLYDFVYDNPLCGSTPPTTPTTRLSSAGTTKSWL